MRDDEEIQRLLKDYEEAVADEQDAASRAASAADELREHGIDPETGEREEDHGGA